MRPPARPLTSIAPSVSTSGASDEWKFDFHGYFRAPFRISFGPPTPANLPSTQNPPPVGAVGPYPPGAEPPVPGNVHVLLARGPYTVEGERALIAEHRLDVLVTKDSGGAMTRAKLTAAREAGLPVVMVDRPPLPESVRATGDVAEAAAWAQG